MSEHDDILPPPASYTGFAPGRTTLNDHIDYWYGIGIGAALKSGITVKYTPAPPAELPADAQNMHTLYMQSNQINGVVARDFRGPRTEKETEAWTNYVVGAFNYLEKFGLKDVKGGRIEVKSEIPMGGGVSSSAALIVSTLTAALKATLGDMDLKGKTSEELLFHPKLSKLVQNVLANVGQELDKNHGTEKTGEYSSNLRHLFIGLDAETGLKYITALLAHRVETEYVKASCGRLDQMSCALAEPGQALKINFDDLSFERLPPLSKGYELMVVDSGQKHKIADPNGAYAKRFHAPQKEIMPHLGISSILQVKPESFEADKQKVFDKFGDEYARWFEHAYRESKRGEEMAVALKFGDMKQLAQLMNDSHASLSGPYENSTPLIDSLVNKIAGGQGAPALAARIVGGGKGGSIAILAESHSAPEVCRAIDDFRRTHAPRIKAEHHSKGIGFIEVDPVTLQSANVSGDFKIAL